MYKGIKIALWFVFTAMVITLLAFTDKKHKSQPCKAPEISISKHNGFDFISEKIILTTLFNKGYTFKDQTIDDINTNDIETILIGLPEVAAAEVYKTIDGTVNMEIKERKPVLRVMANEQSYYIDDNAMIMPLSSHFIAHTHVVTGKLPKIELKDKTILSENSTLRDVYNITNYIVKDPFLDSQIVQIHLNDNGDIILIPRVGNQDIIFGDGNDIEDKFKRLKTFYQKGITPKELNKYKTLNLKYKQQIICSKH